MWGNPLCFRELVVEQNRLSILAIAQEWHLWLGQARGRSCQSVQIVQPEALGLRHAAVDSRIMISHTKQLLDLYSYSLS